MSHPTIRVQGELLSEIPAALYLPPNALKIHLKTFEGPLDLLLYLVRKHQFDILDIPMLLLCRQYTAYMEEILTHDMEAVADYLSMSALLIEIKSKMLLPRTIVEQDDEDDPRADLVRQLLEYERIKSASLAVNALPRRARDFISPRVSIDIPQIAQKPIVQPLQITHAFSTILARLQSNKSYRIIPETISMRAVMSEIIRLFSDKCSFSFFEIVKPKQGGITFMAVLQMQLEKIITLHQEPDSDELIIEQPVQQ